MSDIVERLRKREPGYDCGYCNKAADEIERLRAALAFYANAANYKQLHLLNEFAVSAIVDDGGETARDALALRQAQDEGK